MSKVSITSYIFFIILVIIILIGFSYIIYYHNDKINKINQEVQLNYTTFFIKPMDYDNGNVTSIDFILFKGDYIKKCLSKQEIEIYYQNRMWLLYKYPELYSNELDNDGCYVVSIDYKKEQEGTFIKGLNKIEVVTGLLYQMYYYKKDEYYVNMEVWMPGIKNNSIYLITAHKMCQNANISIFGDFLNNTINHNRLYLKCDGEVRNIGLCFKHSYGIIDISTSYNSLTIPSRLIDYDKCYNTGITIDNNQNYTVSIDFDTKIQNIIAGDYLIVTIIDMDRYNDDGTWKFDYDTKGVNLGIKDLEYLKVFQ